MEEIPLDVSTFSFCFQSQLHEEAETWEGAVKGEETVPEREEAAAS